MDKRTARVLEALQIAGLIALLVGLYLLAGLAWALMAGGLGLAALAVLAELARQANDDEGVDP